MVNRGRRLYVTHDGGNSWLEVSLQAPTAAALATSIQEYGLPVFDSAEHGFVTAVYDAPGGTSWAEALFITTDGGHSWKPTATLPNLERVHGGMPFSSTVTDSRLVTVSSGPAKLDVMALGANGNISQSTADNPRTERFSVLKLSFADSAHGWLVTSSGRLLSTDASGSSWKDITPPITRGAQSAQASGVSLPETPASQPQSRSANAQVSAQSASAVVNVSKHLGFDRGMVICPAGTNCINDMQTWWTFSPYFDTGIYLPNAENLKHDDNLTPSWVAAIQQQGWGLMPLWVGLQAPCAKTPGYKPFSSDPATAQSQGSSDADLAANSMASLGLSNTIVYLDIENYDTTNTSCRAAVRAFLTGWVTELHADGFPFAGVYGNPDPAGLDFSQVSPQPDDVWIAKGDNRVTIWGLQTKGDANLSDSLWIADQRIHQYRINHSETYGGVSAIIDDDIDDATVITSNTPKIYSQYSPKAISYPQSPNTIAWSLNGSGPSAVNSGVQVGGNYYTCDPFCGQSFFAFEYTDATGAYTALNLPGPDSYALGINNPGTIVGCYNDCNNGFIYTVAGSKAIVKTLTIGSEFTAATGINDDNQIVGYWEDINAPQHGFVYLGWPACTPCTLTSIDVPGAAATVLRGINGQGQAAGYWSDANGNWSPFTYSISTGAYNLLAQAPNSTTTFVFSINSNGQITGLGEALGASYGIFVYDENSQTYAQLPHDAADVQGSPNGINDQGVIVGGNDFVAGQAFMATPVPQ